MDGDPNVWHVFPLNDLKEHDTSGGIVRLCHCQPKVEQYGEGFVVIHNSYDGREITENAVDALNKDGAFN